LFPNALFQAQYAPKIDEGWGLAPDPNGGANIPPLHPIAAWIWGRVPGKGAEKGREKKGKGNRVWGD